MRRLFAVTLTATMLLSSAASSFQSASELTFEEDLAAQELPGFDVYDSQMPDWYLEWTEFQAQNGPPWVRAWGAIRLEMEDNARVMAQNGSGQDQVNSDLEALFAAPDSDIHSLLLLAGLCTSLRYRDLCSKYPIHERVVATDPDNALSYFKAIAAIRKSGSGGDRERADQVDSPQVRQLLIAASESTVWKNRADTEALGYFRLAEDFVADHPPPTEKQRLLPDYVVAFKLAHYVPMNTFVDTQWIRERCRGYEERDDQPMISACDRLAALFQRSHVITGFEMEADKVQRADPLDLEGLRLLRRAGVFQLVKDCIEPRWIKYKSRWPSLPRSAFEDYLVDVSELGRWEANRRAAVVDYQTNPDAYTFDPAECEAMLDLGSDEMGELLGENDPARYWWENRNRLLAAAEYAKHVDNDDRMLEEVESLDEVTAVNDPVVEHLSTHGEAVRPLLIEKLCSGNGMTGMAAAYALAGIVSHSTILALLEEWSENKTSGIHCETGSAIQFLINKFEPDFTAPEAIKDATDLPSLSEEVFCTPDERESQASSDDAEDLSALVVFSKSVTRAQSFDCGARPAELRPFKSRSEVPESDDANLYAWLTVQIVNLPQPSERMPAFEARFGSRPLAVAYVLESWRMHGTYYLWVKTSEGWMQLQVLGGFVV